MSDLPEGPSYSIPSYDSWKGRSPDDDRDGPEGPPVVDCIRCGKETYASLQQKHGLGFDFVCPRCLEDLYEEMHPEDRP